MSGYDYDGYTDSQDAFPLDTSQWADTDNDGYGDEVRGPMVIIAPMLLEPLQRPNRLY